MDSTATWDIDSALKLIARVGANASSSGGIVSLPRRVGELLTDYFLPQSGIPEYVRVFFETMQNRLLLHAAGSMISLPLQAEVLSWISTVVPSGCTTWLPLACGGTTVAAAATTYYHRESVAQGVEQHLFSPIRTLYTGYFGDSTHNQAEAGANTSSRSRRFKNSKVRGRKSIAGEVDNQSDATLMLPDSSTEVASRGKKKGIKKSSPVEVSSATSSKGKKRKKVEPVSSNSTPKVKRGKAACQVADDSSIPNSKGDTPVNNIIQGTVAMNSKDGFKGRGKGKTKVYPDPADQLINPGKAGLTE